MDYIFEEWEKRLSAFEASVESDLAEMRQCKAEMRNLTAEISNQLKKGRFERDSERLILSAPEIIIGNVDSEGMLLDGPSVITVRGTNIGLQAAGDYGQVETRAPRIRQVAEDPGDDGREHVVGPLSEVVSQARSIIVHSEDAQGTFATPTVPNGSCGVFIHADKTVDVSATMTAESREQQIDSLIANLESQKQRLKSEISLQKESFKEVSKNLQELMDDRDKLLVDDDAIHANYEDIDWLNKQVVDASGSLAEITASYTDTISMLAEVNRQLKCLNDTKATIVKGDDFKQQTTAAAVMITSEAINLVSADGEGNLRDNKESGIRMLANQVSVASLEEDGQLKPEGKISLQAMHVEVSTTGEKDQQYADDGTLTAATYQAGGDFMLKSNSVTVEAADYELANEELKETQLAPESKIKLRAKTIEMSNEGPEDAPAEGDIIVKSKTLAVNSEQTAIAAVDAEGKLLEGSAMSLVAEKMFVGAQSKDVRSKLLQAASDSVGIFADTVMEAQQGDGKAVLQLADGNAALAGSKTQVYGETTVNANTEVKGALKAPQATIDTLNVKTAFTSPNISDGMAAPAAGASGSLSAKLKEETSGQ